MDRMQRAANLLTELEALKYHTGASSPLGQEMILGITLNDAETLVREILTEMKLREAIERRKRAGGLLPDVRRAFGPFALVRPVRTLVLRPRARKAARTQGGADTP